jgi:predicted nucleotidyltransferase
MLTIDPRLHPKVASSPRPLLFATVSGAHLYGFPSPDSDWDLRGAHILPAKEILGLDDGLQTIELSNKSTAATDGIECDIVSHDIKKFFNLLLKKNGYVLEQLLSPLIVHTTPEHAELKKIAKSCITKHHNHHYLGFTDTQWKLFAKESPRRVKPLLYVYRVLLTGIHLMQTGTIEANLLTLNQKFQLPYIPDLVAKKLAGPEQSTLPDTDFTFHEKERTRLEATLHEAHQNSHLPDLPTARPALHNLLTRLRLATT